VAGVLVPAVMVLTAAAPPLIFHTVGRLVVVPSPLDVPVAPARDAWYFGDTRRDKRSAADARGQAQD